MHRLSREQDPSGALTDSDVALRLAPRSPSVRGVRALVLLAGAGAAQAQSELEAALQIRGDAPQRNNLAGLLLLTGDVDGATRQVSLALEQFPDFSAGHATLASVHMARMEQPQARLELEQAEKLDRELPIINMMWAQYYAGQGEMDQALARAREGVRVRPDDAQSHLLLARFYREAGRYSEMREEASRTLALVPGSRAEDMKRLITGILGPTALEQPDQEVNDQEKAADASLALPEALPEPGRLKLGGGLRLLEDEPGTGSKKPTLADKKEPSEPKADSHLLLLKDPTKLRLQESNSTRR
jgi:tetratricopeptide (TPR) repeat protein